MRTIFDREDLNQELAVPLDCTHPPNAPVVPPTLDPPGAPARKKSAREGSSPDRTVNAATEGVAEEMSERPAVVPVPYELFEEELEVNESLI